MSSTYCEALYVGTEIAVSSKKAMLHMSLGVSSKVNLYLAVRLFSKILGKIQTPVLSRSLDTLHNVPVDHFNSFVLFCNMLLTE